MTVISDGNFLKLWQTGSVLSAALQDPRGQATACCKLGVLYHQQGKLEQAVRYLERFFELARSLGESLGGVVSLL